MSLVSRHQVSLRTRLVALVALLLLAVSLFLLWYFPSRMDGMGRKWLERRATSTAALLSSAVAPALEFEDARAATELLSGLAQTPDAVYAEVHTAEGGRLAAWKGEAAPAAQPGVPSEVEVSVVGDALHVRHPVVTASGGRGVLLVGFSLDELEQEQGDNRLAVGGVAAGVFSLGLAMMFLIGTFLVRPIRRVSDVALRIAEGDLATAETALGGRERVDGLAATLAAGRSLADEVDLLACASARMLQSLRSTSTTLHISSGIFTESVTHLTRIAGEHRQTLARQASALQETQATAEEIKQTSLMAAQKAEAVMQVAQRAEEVSRAGEEAITRSMEGLNAIRARVEDVSRKMAELGERTRQIGGITQTVKDLADQSNMLALNAAIEAVRSGEHGKGFGVVAREIRSLADQSIQSTQRVREILGDISTAIASAVTTAEEGTRQVESGLEQMRVSGTNLGELSGIVRDNAAAVRQISAAVGQQNAGFAQIFTAVTELSAMMEQAVGGIDATHAAVDGLREVSGRITDVAQSYRL